ncbi:hypothetical protein PTSG_07085 [Salpingoeca rosetta]|uniref:Disease resistance R13L4/SHOC-2-like LRR domain-containing protein n=1 Tax=Salpingoeca rosetta (strain ATCC 50818 / BSB-021) TaxID=946362 RepID=F2UE05_SALR5|nr:uncharacterized protein PTSG_07085 [Salpingoeca rosetta]EGD74855.1 hypothetical protein PTSG_07085 [Salpingoeca rosetta]|eukprot:XP_004992500.1 hypothetical protein PTSG_07085 [Salpingoeca rosetta]
MIRVVGKDAMGDDGDDGKEDGEEFDDDDDEFLDVLGGLRVVSHSPSKAPLHSPSRATMASSAGGEEAGGPPPMDDREYRAWAVAFKHPQRVRSLNMASKQITRVPDDITSCPVLEKLNLNNNQLQSLPDCIGEVKHLKLLHVGNNKLHTLPSFLLHMPDLQTLQAFHNSITTVFPQPVQEPKFSSLRALNLNNNLITELPECIGGLANLESLSVDFNQLTTLPSSIGKLRKLRMCSAKGNQITALPEAMGQLEMLRELILIDNALVDIPLCLLLCRRLAVLDVSLNRIRTLDWRVVDHSRIKHLHLEKNPFKSKSRGHIPEMGHVLPLQELVARRVLASISDPIMQGGGDKMQQQQQQRPGHHASTAMPARGKVSRESFRKAFVAGVGALNINDKCKDFLLCGDVCSVCGGWFVSVYLEAVQFIPARSGVHLDRGLAGIPVRKMVCSRKCFDEAKYYANT